MRGQMTRFHDKLVDSMIFDIFNSVYNQCGHDMKDTQKTLSFLFFGEPNCADFDKCNHPEVLKTIVVKRMVKPLKFIKIFEQVHNFK